MNRLAVVLLVVLLAGQVWAIDCKQITVKYIKASQQGDYKTLVGMSEIYQNGAKAITRDYPKYKVESALAELFEREKRNVDTWMFIPSAKWKILETKIQKFPQQKGKDVTSCRAYIQTEYADDDNAPSNKSDYSSIVDGKRLKSIITSLVFNVTAGTIYGSPSVDLDMTWYWDTLTKEWQAKKVHDKENQDAFEKQMAEYTKPRGVKPAYETEESQKQEALSEQ